MKFRLPDTTLRARIIYIPARAGTTAQNHYEAVASVRSIARF